MLFGSTWQDRGKATLLRADARGNLASLRRAILLVVAVPVPRPRHVGGGRGWCHAILLRWRSRFRKVALSRAERVPGVLRILAEADTEELPHVMI
jgi:hypothetical protein